MKLSFSLCFILVCIGLSVVAEGKRTTKSRSYSSSYSYSSSNEDSNSEDDKTYCELLDLPQTCTLEYVPVCAHIRDCEGNDCFETAGNVCAACSAGTYNYFVSGECPGKPEQEEESNTDEDRLYCELADFPPVCPAASDPVCAHLRDCEGDSCFKTEGNGCLACSAEGAYDYFVSGECPGDGESEQEEESEDRLYCELADFPGVCPQIYDPVCAHLRDCEGSSCFETVGNGCTACSSEGKFDYFVSGECPQDDRLYCELADFPGVCPQIYDPVCAHIRGCEGDSCSETIGNGCTACSAEGKYDYFVSGECPQDDRLYCELADFPGVCPQIYDPVCAHLRNCEGDSCFETIGNGCTACSSEGKYDYFVSGECQGDGGSEQEEESEDRVYCELADFPGVCPPVYNPVCAHLRDCEGDACFKTVGDACTACSSEGKYDYFVAGECPEPERTYCDDDNRPDFCTKEYFPVCAHHSDGCTSTAGNTCMACSDHSVEYYTLGAC